MAGSWSERAVAGAGRSLSRALSGGSLSVSTSASGESSGRVPPHPVPFFTRFFAEGLEACGVRKSLQCLFFGDGIQTSSREPCSRRARRRESSPPCLSAVACSAWVARLSLGLRPGPDQSAPAAGRRQRVSKSLRFKARFRRARHCGYEWPRRSSRRRFFRLRSCRSAPRRAPPAQPVRPFRRQPPSPA